MNKIDFCIENEIPFIVGVASILGRNLYFVAVFDDEAKFLTSNMETEEIKTNVGKYKLITTFDIVDREEFKIADRRLKKLERATDTIFVIPGCKGMFQELYQQKKQATLMKSYIRRIKLDRDKQVSQKRKELRRYRSVLNKYNMQIQKLYNEYRSIMNQNKHKIYE